MLKRVEKFIHQLGAGFCVFSALAFFSPCAAYATALDPQTASVSQTGVSFTWTRIPAAAPFAVLSAAADFNPVISSQTLPAGTSSYSYGSLDSNTTYYFKVKLASETDSSYMSVSTATLPAAPGGAAYSYIAETEMLLEWNVGSNAADSVYEVSVSSNNFSQAYTGDLRFSGVFNGSVIFGGLSQNTTYYARVRVLGKGGTATGYSNTASGVTLARGIGSVTVTYSSSVVSGLWTACPASPQSLSCSGYVFRVSLTEDFYTELASSTNNRAVSSLAISGLVANTTYYFRADTRNLAGVITEGEVYYFSTLTTVPTGTRVTAVNTSSITVTLNQYPLTPRALSASGYIFEASSSVFSAGYTSTKTHTLSESTLVLDGLLRNTTYFIRAGAYNWMDVPNYGSVISTVTLAWPVDPDLVEYEVSATSILVTYQPLPLEPHDLSCEGYRIELATVPFDQAVNVLFSSTAVKTNNSFSFSNLVANKRYYLRMGTYNISGGITYVNLAPAQTVPGPAPEFVAIKSTGTTYITLQWSTHTCDGYSAEVASDITFGNIVASSVTTNTALSFLQVSGLLANTSYYTRMGNLYNGATAYTRTDPRFNSTLALPVTSAGFSGVGPESVTLNWVPRSSAPVSASAEGYVVNVSTASNFSGIVYSSKGYVNSFAHPDTFTVSYDSSGQNEVIPNTTYYARVATLNWDDNPSYYSVAGTTVTNVAEPYAVGVSTESGDVHSSSITLHWNTNRNPADTRYEVALYLNTGGRVAITTVTGSFTDFTGLAPNTSYYAYAQALGRSGNASGKVYSGDIVTAANIPVSLSIGSIGATQATFSFGFDSNPYQTRYRIQLATVAFTACGAYGTGCNIVEKYIQPSGGASTSTVMGPIFSNSVYYSRVASINTIGVYSSWADFSLFTSTPSIPARASQTFSDVRLDEMTVNWSHGSNLPGTTYEVYLSSGNPALFPSVDKASAATTAVSYRFLSLSSGTAYSTWVRAMGTGVNSDYWPVISTRTLSSVENQTTPNADYYINLPTSYGTIEVYVPARTFGISVAFNVSQAMDISSGAVINSPAAKLKATGIGVEIQTTPHMQPTGNIRITIPYRPADLPNGTNRSRLALAFYDTTNAIWVPLPSVSDLANNTVQGLASHLSLFQIMEVLPGDSLDNIKVFPNPFDPGSSNKYMQFSKLPAGSSVKIYTYLGELVREFTADIAGNATWDGRNTYGSDVASGVYVVLVKTEDGAAKKILKIAVER